MSAGSPIECEYSAAIRRYFKLVEMAANFLVSWEFLSYSSSSSGIAER